MINSAARLYSELAETLRVWGHHATVITSQPKRYLAQDDPASTSGPPRREELNGVDVHRVPALRVMWGVPLLRGFEQFLTALTYLLAGLFLRPRQAVIVYSPPLPLGISAYILSRLWRAQCILNVQDLYPKTAVDLGLLRNGLLVAVANGIESFLYRHVDSIVVHSPSYRDHVAARGGDPSKVHLISNWEDLEAFTPGKGGDGFREDLGIEGAFLVVHAGVMGFAQGLYQVVEAAVHLREYRDIVFLLVGDGAMRGGLERQAQDAGNVGVRFLGLRPSSDYQRILAAADVCLVSLHKQLRSPGIPGKLQSIMAAGKATICCLRRDSDPAHMVEEASCGLTVEAGEPEALAEAVLRLYRDRELCETMGRQGRGYAEEHFRREVAVRRYEALLARPGAK